MNIELFTKGLSRDDFTYKVFGKGRDKYFIIDYLDRQLSEGHKGVAEDAERAIANLLSGYANRKYYYRIEYINILEDEDAIND